MPTRKRALSVYVPLQRVDRLMHGDGKADRLRGTAEHREHTVTHGLDDFAVEFGGAGAEDLEALVHEGERRGLIAADAPAVPRKIGKQDRLEGKSPVFARQLRYPLPLRWRA